MTKTGKPDKAFILAAGLGSRLRPYTDHVPKPMVRLGSKPLMGHIYEHCKKAGIKEVIVNTCYKRDVIHAYLKDNPLIPTIFSDEDTLLDTGGGIKKALHYFQAPFFVINGDSFWQDGKKQLLENLANHWNPDEMDILIAFQPLNRMILTHGIGDYDLDKKGNPVRNPDKTGAYMFTGIRIVKPEIFKSIQESKFSFLRLMDEAEQAGRLKAVIHDGDWHHISTPQDLERIRESL